MKLDDTDIFELHAEFCKIIASSRRLRIIQLLAESEKSVGEIAGSLKVPSSNISQHLRVLRNHNVVKTRKEGQTVYYSLSNLRLPKACMEIRSILIEGMKKTGKTASKMSK